MGEDWLKPDEISALSAAVTAAVTAIYTIGTFMLWKVTSDTKKSIELQLRNQIEALNSSSRHAITASHQALYLEILKNDGLIKAFAGSNRNIDQVTGNILTSLVLNHCASIFADYKSNIFHGQGSYRIDRDLKDVFSLEIVRSRWDSVKSYHPFEFVKYVDLYIIPQISR